jgi:hypothetical protein
VILYFGPAYVHGPEFTGMAALSDFDTASAILEYVGEVAIDVLGDAVGMPEIGLIVGAVVFTAVSPAGLISK